MEMDQEIVLEDEKFRSVGVLRELLCKIQDLEYCTYGSFLSSIHFKRSFKSPFDLLVRDELEAIDVLSRDFDIDGLHGIVSLGVPGEDKKSGSFKIRLVDVTAKNENIRQYLIKNAELRTCVVANSEGEVEKFELKTPRRGPTIIALLLENDESPVSTCSIVEKIIWSLTNIGVAPLLRESRFIEKEIIHQSADIVDDLFVARANKTASLLHAQGSAENKLITAAELKKLGRPFAALLRA